MKEFVIVLAGNPNVGKSTVFNALTGMNQHTGNWPGKTVSNAKGITTFKDTIYTVYDLPGTYSLIAHSKEEEVARDFICFGKHDVIVVVCDAVCLERNLNLVLQTLEITKNVIVCVNLMDEAKKKDIHIDLKELSKLLGVPVIGACARDEKGLNDLMQQVEATITSQHDYDVIAITYNEVIESAINMVTPALDSLPEHFNKRFLALKLIDDDTSFIDSLCESLKVPVLDMQIQEQIKKARTYLLEHDILVSELKDMIVSTLVFMAEEISKDVVTIKNIDYQKKDRKIDRILTNKWTGIPIMILLLMGIFWITIEGANIPSKLLFSFFQWIEGYLSHILTWLLFPTWIHDMLLNGVYRVVTWVTAVMLPPMAIFFPLFTLLEDLGFLPRIAFNLDSCFKKCHACGKQALTMCMGFGCNAAGVVGCRIIDSPRERLIAIITNNFVPCNGRFPTLITIITMFFIGFQSGFQSSLLSVLILTGIILLGICFTFLISRILSTTLLKGVPSSFTLELPPYRMPQFGKVIVRSIFDRTLFVLKRALAVAVPAGFIIWMMANIKVGDVSVLSHCATFLDPAGKMIGLDGIILMAFLLGFPANEIVVPIMIMGYMATGELTDFSNLESLKTLLINNGWTSVTALCFMLFSLMHFPCSTTCLTIKKETGSWKWTALSFLIPTVTGIVICFSVVTGVHIWNLLF